MRGLPQRGRLRLEQCEYCDNPIKEFYETQCRWRGNGMAPCQACQPAAFARWALTVAVAAGVCVLGLLFMTIWRM